MGEGICIGGLDGIAGSFGAIVAQEFTKSLVVFRGPVVQYESGFDALRQCTELSTLIGQYTAHRLAM